MKQHQHTPQALRGELHSVSSMTTGTLWGQAGQRSVVDSALCTRRLTRTAWASTLVSNAFGQANFSGGTRGCPGDICIRLQCRDDTGTGNAVLQINALLIAWPSWSGLLQGHADDARPFCATLVWAWLVPLPRCIRSCAGLERMCWLRFFCRDPRTALPRPAHFPLAVFPASSHLV